MRGEQNAQRPKPVGGLSTGVLETKDWDVFPKPGPAVSYLQRASLLTLPDPQTYLPVSRRCRVHCLSFLILKFLIRNMNTVIYFTLLL